jgi:NADH:ubiquinone oxidoreductase subunit 3 (subunit A)
MVLWKASITSIVYSTVNRRVHFLVIFITIFLVLIRLLFLLVNYLLNGYLTVKRKKTPFERGFNSIGKRIISYSLRFFFLVLIFVFFELEFFLIFFLVFFSRANFYLFVLVILLVTLGFILEWYYSKLVFLFN